jgi:hypothetical protein
MLDSGSHEDEPEDGVVLARALKAPGRLSGASEPE